MANLRHYKCGLSVLKNHTTAYLRLFYKFELSSACHTKAPSIPPGEKKDCDYIGPPHPVSNLRPIHFHVPANETPIETHFRLKQEQVQQWNQDFWTSHNKRFVQERKEFMAAKLPQSGETSLSAEEMSVFYKGFLDKNWRRHIRYNVEWYKRNIQLVVLHLRVKLSQLGRQRKRVNNG